MKSGEFYPIRFLKAAFKRATGLKWARMVEWGRVVRAEGREIGVKNVVFSLGAAVLTLGGVSKGLWRERMASCGGCPVYDRRMKRCRPYAGSKLGCGCYMPLKALVRDDACWGYAALPGAGIGFAR